VARSRNVLWLSQQPDTIALQERSFMDFAADNKFLKYSRKVADIFARF
jgi:hypothetical protein